MPSVSAQASAPGPDNNRSAAISECWGLHISAAASVLPFSPFSRGGRANRTVILRPSSSLSWSSLTARVAVAISSKVTRAKPAGLPLERVCSSTVDLPIVAIDDSASGVTRSRTCLAVEIKTVFKARPHTKRLRRQVKLQIAHVYDAGWLRLWALLLLLLGLSFLWLLIRRRPAALRFLSLASLVSLASLAPTLASFLFVLLPCRLFGFLSRLNDIIEGPGVWTRDQQPKCVSSNVVPSVNVSSVDVHAHFVHGLMARWDSGARNMKSSPRRRVGKKTSSTTFSYPRTPQEHLWDSCKRPSAFPLPGRSHLF